jgi:hypothetical protein
LPDTGEKGSTQFQKTAYILLANPDLVLVHYTGTESVYVSLKHGNRMQGVQEHKRTCPSVIQTIREHVQHSNPMSVYRNSVVSNTAGVHQGVMNARNRKQVENTKYRMDNSLKISRDEIYNSILLGQSSELGDFVSHITIHPHMVTIILCEESLKELNKLLQLDTSEPVMLFYDTTFNLTNSYVSPLLMSHVLLKNTEGNKKSSPTIPLGYLIHERKFQKHHEQFFATVKEKVPK